MVKRLLFAISFLTTIPISPQSEISDSDLVNSLSFFPFSGLLVGGAATAAFYLGLRIWNHWVAAVLWLCVNALMTGGLHLDGWADTFDGLGSRKDRDTKLNIMRDSRIGAMGAIALLLLFGLKGTLLSSHSASMAWLVFMPALGRAAMVLSIRMFPSARETGLGAGFRKGSLPATGWGIICLSLGWFFLMWPSLWALASALIAITLSLIFARAIASTLSGLTGDTYGAICEFTELVFLMAITALGRI